MLLFAVNRPLVRICVRIRPHRCNSTFDDSKLRQIIETSNMGMSQQLEKHKREIDSKKKPTMVTRLERDYQNAQQNVADRIRRGLVGNELTTSSAKSDKLEMAKTELNLNQRLLEKLSDLRATLTSATKALNDLTGYTEIEKLKKTVDLLEAQLKTAKADLRKAKSEYTDAIQRRSDLQQEINELLTRKHNWTASDLERFTELYRNDHQIQNEEKLAEMALDDAELAVDAVQVKLTQLILTRYHEEQIWSDKIRQASTWGTWTLMGVNVMIFAIAAFFVEPWKRRRLVDAFHVEVQQKLDEFTLEIQQLSEKLGNGEKGSTTAASAVSAVSAAKLSPSLTLSTTTATVPILSSTDTALATNHVLSFTSIKSWTALKLWVETTVQAVRDPNTLGYYMEKTDMGIFSAVLVTVGGSLGAALTYVIVNR